MAWERQDERITSVSNGLMSFEFTVVVCVLKSFQYHRSILPSPFFNSDHH